MIDSLFAQRRRWLNGAFFSLLYYVANFYRVITQSDHSLFRRLALLVQFVYQCAILALNWFGVGSLFLSLVTIFQLVATSTMSDPAELMWIFSLCYSFLIVLQVLWPSCTTAAGVDRGFVWLCVEPPSRLLVSLSVNSACVPIRCVS